MKKTAHILSIVYALFLGMFAFDEIGNSIVGFLIHLIPTFIVGIAILISRKYQVIGLILFGFLSILTIIFFKTYQDVIVFILISLPLIIIALLLSVDLLNTDTKHRL